MAHKWNRLKKTLSPAAQARVDARVRETLRALPIGEIRKAVGMTQIELAERLDIAQGSVSKIENATDMYISTLRKYVKALGGELHITAKFSRGRSMEIVDITGIPRRPH